MSIASSARLPFVLRRRSSEFVGDCDAFDNTMPRPFTYPGQHLLYSRRELLKIVLMCVFLVPVIRIVLFILLALIAMLIATIVTIGTKKGDPKVEDIPPMSQWRMTTLQYTLPPISRAMLACFGYLKLNIQGRPIPHSTRVIVCNHVTPIDAYLVCSLSIFSAVAMHDTAKTPLIGTIARAIQCIFIDRSSSKDRFNTLKEITRRALDGRYPPLLIFPEGTTTNNTTLARFRKGAFAAGVPVQPIVLKFKWNRFDPSWTNYSPSMFGILFRLVCQIYNEVEVRILPTYIPNAAEIDNSDLYAENVRKVMGNALQVPIVAYGVEDSIIEGWLLARQSHFSTMAMTRPEFGVTMFELRTRFNAPLSVVKSLVTQFHQIDTNLDRLISFDEFVRHCEQKNPQSTLGVPNNLDFAKIVFRSFDSNCTNHLDYREFVIGVLTLNDQDDVSELEEISFRDLYNRAKDANAALLPEPIAE